MSFACSWAFAELRKMEGNAKIIKLICRDENVHLGFTQQLLKALVQEDPDFAKIKLECEQEIISCANDITKYYDDLIQATETYNRVCNVGDLDITMEKSLYELKNNFGFV